MYCFAWNMCGFNKPCQYDVVHKWIDREKLAFGCLIETRVNKKNNENIMIFYLRTRASKSKNKILGYI